MGLKRCLKILNNEEAAKVHKLLIKWLNEIIKKEKGMLHMLALRKRCLDYSKVYSDVHVSE